MGTEGLRKPKKKISESQLNWQESQIYPGAIHKAFCGFI